MCERLQELVADIRICALVYSRLTDIRTELSAIAEKTRDRDTRRELLDVLDDIEGDAEPVSPGHDEPLDYQILTELSGRLRELADKFAGSLSCQHHAEDARLAALAISRLASLKFRIGEIAEAALSQDGAATARDLRTRSRTT